MKNIKKSILTIATICGVSFMYSNISIGATGVVTGETVRIRKEPDTNSKIVTLVSQRDEVEIIEESGNWYKIKYKDYEGYISKDYLKVDKQTNSSVNNENTNNSEEENNKQSTNENEEEKEQSEENQKVEDEGNNEETPKIEESQEVLENVEKILGEDVELYIIPSITSSRIDTIKKDTKILIEKNLNKWYYISCDNNCGWIAKADFKEKQEETKEEEKKQEEVKQEKTETTKKGYINSASVNLRKSASKESEVLDSLTKNTEVEILSEEDSWYKVKVKGKTGYIATKLVSDKKVEETTSRSLTEQRQDKKEIENIEESTNSSENNLVTGEEIVNYAKKYLGYKYVSGGTSPSSGFDCSGFTQYVFKHFGVTLNRTASEQSNNGVAVKKSNLKKGDLVIFKNDAITRIGHVGIYIGNNQFIHAANASRGVVTDSLDSSYYSPRYVTARRVI